MRPDAYKDFVPSIQATIATSDQAYLASALSLDAAVKGAKPISGTDLASLVSDPDKVISRDQLLKGRSAAIVGPNGKLALEPTIIEDQKKRFLDHLHQLRRNNEGDDNADAPGYALNLVRVPVSVLTGECTQTGYGAECTFTATPHLPDNLLPLTFHSLVINDLVDLLGLPITKMIEGAKDEEELNALWRKYAQSRWISNLQTGRPGRMLLTVAPRLEQAVQQKASVDKPNAGSLVPPSMSISRSLNMLSPIDRKNSGDATFSNTTRVENKLSQAIKAPAFASSLRPGKQRPVPSTQITEVFGFQRLLEIVICLRPELETHTACGNMNYYLDVQSVLREEMNAAYEFLSAEHNKCLWEFCNSNLLPPARPMTLP